MQKLVDFAERQEFNSPAVENYLREIFSDYDLKNFSSVVLGCTHFNYFKDTMRKLLPENVKILDGNEGTLNRLIQLTNLKPEPATKKFPSVKYFYSGRPVTSPEESERLKNYLRRLDEMYLIN